MLNDTAACYRALQTHDRRFDGHLFVGVASTGIYCRPVCTVRTPKAENCRYFANAAVAEAAGFRPCLRCRPELAPAVARGVAPVDASGWLAWAAAQRIENGELGDSGLSAIAVRLGVTDRHLRRVFRAEFGVTPIAYAQTQRLLLAKRLLADTSLPVSAVALAAGFRSLRRFESALHQHYGLAPSALRRESGHTRASGVADTPESLRFELSYRPPFDWERLLTFLGGRLIAGVESVDAGIWRRTVRLANGTGLERGWIQVGHLPARCALQVDISEELLPVLPAVLAAVGRVFDLSCEPLAVAAALGTLAEAAPGLRVPGAFDGFEMAVRAILGQQVTVKAAHTLAGRFALAFGTPLDTPVTALQRTFPTAGTVATLAVERIAELGIVRQRALAIKHLAEAVVAGDLDLAPTCAIDPALTHLREIPGIGEWTANYIALRALAWPDAWPSGDVALMKALGTNRRREADRLAEQWRPWRAYATLHLWRQLAEHTEQEETENSK